jgi:secreted trypsin-like serine protease
MVFFRWLIIGLIIAFAVLVWLNPDLLIRLIDPTAERSKAWLEQRRGSDTAISQKAEIPAAEQEVTEPVSGDILPGPVIPEVVMIDAPELAGSLRETGFRTNHSTKPDIPDVVSITPDVPGELEATEIFSIVGGESTSITEVPWMVGLNIHTEIIHEGDLAIATEICGGAVYDRRWIVTAAHCIDGDFNEIEVIAGASSLESEMAVRRVSQRAFLHAGYERDVLREDIGLIELAEPLPDYVPNGPWPTMQQALAIPTVTKVTGRGFGLTEEGRPSDTLKRVELDVQESTLRVIRVADNDQGVEGLCQGDSGSPVTADMDGAEVIIGMVSFTEAVPGSRSCSTPGFVAGLVSLEGYMDDIRSLVNFCSAEPDQCNG